MIGSLICSGGKVNFTLALAIWDTLPPPVFDIFIKIHERWLLSNKQQATRD